MTLKRHWFVLCCACLASFALGLLPALKGFSIVGPVILGGIAFRLANRQAMDWQQGSIARFLLSVLSCLGAYLLAGSSFSVWSTISLLAVILGFHPQAVSPECEA